MATARIIELRNQGELHLYEGSNGAERVTLKAPASITTTWTLTLPNAPGSASQFLQTDGAGAATWASGTSTLQSAYDNGATISIGGGGSVNLDRATGGEVLRLRASTSGNPFQAFLAGASEGRLTQVAGGAFQLGSFSTHNVELLSNNLARMTILSTGEVGIGGAPESGVKLKVIGSNMLLENTRAYAGETVAGANLNLIGMNSSDEIEIGNTTSSVIRMRNASQAMLLSGFNLLLPSSAAATARLSILEATTTDGIQVTKNTLSGLGIRVDQDTDNIGIFCQNSIGTSPAIVGEHLQTTSKAFQGRSLNGAKTTLTIKEIDSGTLSGASVTLSGAIPAGSIVLAITVRSLVTVTTSDGSAILVGTATDDNRWFTISSPFNSGNGGKSVEDTGSTDVSAAIYKVATDIVLKPTGAATFTAGQMRVAIHFFGVDFPTS